MRVCASTPTLYAVLVNMLMYFAVRATTAFVSKLYGAKTTIRALSNSHSAFLPHNHSLPRGRSASYSLGVIKTNLGLAVQCFPADRETVRRHIHPEQAAKLGNLCWLSKENSTIFLVKGFPNSLNKEDVHETFLTASCLFPCRPVKPTRCARGTNDWLVFAPVESSPRCCMPTIRMQNQ